ncbi:MAG TPA: helix-turn-helix domain-containing protein [Candidatus Dormibacteraeota bacterium]|nr:helix-turn-helix domain-containing protein [Candidatus Dormibacteraeota bacterium]
MASGRGEAPVATEANPKRRRLPGVNLRPGSVKQARLEAGLSLAQLGKGHVTAPAIYLIETGRTRPSLPTLEHIASRTGKPVEFFLAEPGGPADDIHGRLIELEALVADGRGTEAIALGRALLDRSSSAFRLGRIRFLLGQAHLASSEPERAAGLLADARTHFEAVGDGAMLAECLGALATVATLTHAKDAVALAENALSVCRRLKPVPAPTEVRLLGILADAYVANLDWDRAIAAYEESIEGGRGVSNLRQVARQYAGLGAAYRDSGEVETAARYTGRSVALLELFRDRDLLAKSEHSLAMVHLKRGDLAAARCHLERALELCSDFDLGCGRSVVLLGLAELAMREGEADRAQELATEALDLAARLEEGATIAEAHEALGRIADLRGEHAESDRQFEDAIRGFEALGLRERLLQSHGAYAEILERRGELARAYVHMKEALQASRPGLLRRDEAEEQVTSA